MTVHTIRHRSVGMGVLIPSGRSSAGVFCGDAKNPRCSGYRRACGSGLVWMDICQKIMPPNATRSRS